MRVVAQLLIPLLVVLNTAPWVIAAEKTQLSDTKILHHPIESALSGIVIPLSANIEDSAGVEVVRAYFKSTVGTIFYYVPLMNTKDNNYSGLIPAPAADAGEIEYLILVKNKQGVVVKSQQYHTVITENPRKPQPDAKQKTINVYSESPYASKYITGFEAGYDFQVADPSEKYGVVAGLYNPESVSWISTDAVPGGTAAEPSSSSMNPLLIGGGVLAGIAVVAVALGGGGGGGGSSTTPPATDTPDTPTTPPSDQTPLASGTWKLSRFEYDPCASSGTGQSQTVSCTADKTFESVSPSTATVSVPADASATCVSGTTRGLTDVFVTGQNCDAVEACNTYSASNLTSKDCQTTSITIIRDSGKNIEVWDKQ